MISSLSKKQKISNIGSNYLLFSSATHNSNRASANCSIQDPYPSAQSDCNEADKSQPRMFKIRTFNSKTASAKHPKIEGKRITQEAIACIKEDCEMRIFKYNYNNRRPSVQLSKQPINQRSCRVKKNVQPTESAIFREIQLIKKQKQERHQMKFQFVDLSQYSQLAHRPHIWTNTDRQIQQNPCQFVIIFSVNLINLNPKKIFRSRQKSYNSQKSVDSNHSSSFTVDSQAILANICGNHQRSFFNNCKIYFKVNDNSQMNDLKQFLSENGLKNYDGIIDVRKKVTETHNFYSIRQLISQNQKLIILEEEQTLRYEIPLIECLETFVFTLADRNLTYSNINKLIKLLRNIEVQTLRGNSQSYCTVSPTKESKKAEEKENLNPNTGFLNKTFTRTSKQHNTAQKNKNSFKSTLFINSPLKSKTFQFDWRLLTSKVYQINEMKKIRQQLRETRSNFRNNMNLPSSMEKLPKSKSRNKSIEGKCQFNTSRQAAISIQLEGSFKEKLVKYVKILVNERESQPPSKENKAKQRIDNKEDDLQELTLNLTTRLKSKTPFQLVGDLIRSNAHIGKQIEKYINTINPVQKIIGTSNNSHNLTKCLDERVIQTFQI